MTHAIQMLAKEEVTVEIASIHPFVFFSYSFLSSYFFSTVPS